MTSVLLWLKRIILGVNTIFISHKNRCSFDVHLCCTYKCIGVSPSWFPMKVHIPRLKCPSHVEPKRCVSTRDGIPL